ncbi:hypothetical protein [Micromonospora musae]|uniref:Uncharacterized protein n=1 Tax=Micromonospora musae TaxID=1894970 RepID=A0A3A9YHX1_9ACTN|nr:hypothetical protein [Micromonospora musae]RKN36591.1 hypothetical protein D7044_02880 [Micromonospora musae]
MVISWTVVAVVSGNGWRWWLSAIGAGLIALPLAQGAPLVAVVAAGFGVIVVAAWAWGTRSGGGLGLTVGTALAAVLAATFAVSQWPRGLIAVPWFDWFAVWLLLGGVCLAALIIDRAVRAVPAHLPAGWNGTAARARWVVSVTALSIVLLFCGCGLGLVAADGDGSLRIAVGDEEILPLPPSLRLVSVESCASGGSSGNCTAEFVVAAADGADRAMTVTRLVGHLHNRGWPLRPEGAVYSGRHEPGGILNWTAHQMWLYVDAKPSELESPQPAGAVVVYIDNL